MIPRPITVAADSIASACAALAGAALPAACPVCDGPLGRHEAGVCLPCWTEVEEVPAHPFGGRAISSITVLGRYEGRLAGIVRSLKFNALPRAGTLLGDRLARRLLARPVRVDLVVPVPLHWRRKWARGYNQAERIGRPIARALGRPLRCGALVRVRFTPSQTGRDRRGRVANVRRAFAVPPHAAVRARLEGKAILLVDDVVTTGATVRECARILLASGAEAVHVAAAAHTPARELQS